MKFKFTIIGAGVIGLAIAKTLSEKYKGDSDIIVVEKEKAFGQGISSRNSEVIHTGIYYPHKSLKHTLCIKGKDLLYKYCVQKNIPYKKCGKLIIATNKKEKSELDKVFEQANLNGVENVSLLSAKQALELEPNLNATAAILSQETGIIDTHMFMKNLETDISQNNGTVIYNAEVNTIEYNDHKYSLKFKNPELNEEPFESEYIINSAGLSATAIATLLKMKTPKMYPCKGTYFTYSGKHPFTHLVYPIPHKKLTGLGVHITLDLGGRLKFGPDTQYIDSLDDFSIDENKKEQFFQAASKLIKNIDKTKIVPDQAGIRPKIQGPNDSEVKDFYIKEENSQGFPKFINLIGIESPGLTTSLAIGKYILAMI